MQKSEYGIVFTGCLNIYYTCVSLFSNVLVTGSILLPKRGSLLLLLGGIQFIVSLSWLLRYSVNFVKTPRVS